jgi:hypothetical protein
MRVPQRLSAASIAEPLFVGAASLIWYAQLRDHAPQYDEFYHLLSAQSWALTGDLAIAEGQYLRAEYFSKLLGLFFRVFGPSIELARLLTATAAAVLIAVVFVWTRRHIGRLEAWIASFGLAASTTVASMAVLVRFYSAHALLFFVASIVVYSLLTPDRGRSPFQLMLLVAFAVALVVASLHLQVTTLVGLVAVMTWAAVDQSRRLAALSAAAGKSAVALTAIVGFLLAALVLLIQTGTVRRIWAVSRSHAYWASGSSADFYHWQLLEMHPVFYGLFPLVVLVAVTRYRRPAVFCAVVFVVGMLAHSAAATRGIRYVFYLMPFFVILCAMAISQTILWVRAAATQALAAVQGRPQPPDRGGLVGTVCVIASITFLLAATPDIFRTGRLAQMGMAHMHPQYSVRWLDAAPILREAFATSNVVVTTNALSALYYLGNYDVEFSATRLHETPLGEEFDRDPRTGRPVISSQDSLALLMGCFATGIVVAERWSWGDMVYGIDPRSRTLLEEFASPVLLPDSSRLIAYRWNNPQATFVPTCPNVGRQVKAAER